MKEKGGKRSYILDATKKTKDVYIPECRRKDFSNFVDLTTISRLKDLRALRSTKNGDEDLTEEDKRSLDNMRIKGEKVDPLDAGVMRWIRQRFSRSWC